MLLLLLLSTTGSPTHQPPSTPPTRHTGPALHAAMVKHMAAALLHSMQHQQQAQELI
jgi:hypothetical protein